jgi:hypothetical protein
MSRKEGNTEDQEKKTRIQRRERGGRNEPVLIRLEASDSPSPRVPASESISSMKMIEGLASRAIWKSCLTSLKEEEEEAEWEGKADRRSAT